MSRSSRAATPSLRPRHRPPGRPPCFYSIITLAQAGDNIVSSNKLYGGTYTQFNDILPTLGITVKFVDAEDPENFRAAIDDKTRAVFCETVSNPALEIVDLEAVAEIAHANGLPLIVDSTFSTPYLTQPLRHGADIIVHVAHEVDGRPRHRRRRHVHRQGRLQLGRRQAPALRQTGHLLRRSPLGPRPPRDALAPLAYKLRMLTVPLRNLGACHPPDNAWMFLQGIETLSLRMERHCENSLKVAEHLKSHPKVAWVRYPGLKDDPSTPRTSSTSRARVAAMVIFGIKAADAPQAGPLSSTTLKLIAHVANVGDARTLAIHPATTTHSQMNPEQQVAAGAPPDMVRLSIGLETAEDILADIDQALEAAN